PEAFARGGLGTLVPPEDVGALAAAMAAMAAAPERGSPERQAVHDRVAARMALSRHVEDVLAVYRGVLTR
ncbi:MAG: glycosyltransferase family 1 protein, partial [Verrucomicrobia bacterium]|nr:glycosyltransferase family 1 protein [Verrucomicrobiota bacterium]